MRFESYFNSWEETRLYLNDPSITVISMDETMTGQIRLVYIEDESGSEYTAREGIDPELFIDGVY